MKKRNYILPLLAALSLFTSCEDEEYRDPSATLENYISEHRQLLTSSEHGWRFDYSPNESAYGVFTFMMDFEEDGRVTMQTDKNFHYLYATAEEEQEAYGPRESDYTIQNSQGPVLTFATYSLLSKLADPELFSYGSGWGGENDFVIMGHSTDGDTIYLKGLKYQKRHVLVKNTQGWDDYFASTNAVIDAFADASATNTYFRDIVIGEESAVMTGFDMTTRRGVVYQYKGEDIVADTCRLRFTPEGIYLTSPLQIGETTVTHFSYNGSKEFLVNAEAGTSVKVAENGRPKLSFKVRDKVLLGTYLQETADGKVSKIDMYQQTSFPKNSLDALYAVGDKIQSQEAWTVIWIPDQAGNYYLDMYDQYTSASGQALRVLARCGIAHSWITGTEDEIMFRGIGSAMYFYAQNPNTGDYEEGNELARQFEANIKGVYTDFMKKMFGASSRDRIRCVVVPSPDGKEFHFVNKEDGSFIGIYKLY